MSSKNGFTENAHLYQASQTHREVDDLERAFQDLGSLFGLSALDVATGTGHAARFLAKKQAHVFAVDINDEMLRVAQEESDKLSLPVRYLYSPAHDLNFDEEAFHIITCRLAAHHFGNPDGFLSECRRVLKPKGALVLIDNIVPEGAAGEWMNRYEKERDKSHHRCLSSREWNEHLLAAGFEVKQSTPVPTTIEFGPWMERMSWDQARQDEMWEKLLHAPDEVHRAWTPREHSGQREFTLSRQVFVAEKI